MLLSLKYVSVTNTTVGVFVGKRLLFLPLGIKCFARSLSGTPEFVVW